MANEKHLNILNKVVVHWNEWCKAIPDIKPDLDNDDSVREKYPQSML